MDQSIQPGDGGYGFVPEVQAFKGLGRFVVFASGTYLINPRETNDFPRNGPSTAVDTTGAENHLLSIADQYAARVGVATHVKSLGVNLGLRWEGTRSTDLIGGSRGRRRPGYTLGIDPGVSYTWRSTLVSVNVPWRKFQPLPGRVMEMVEIPAGSQLANTFGVVSLQVPIGGGPPPVHAHGGKLAC